MSEFRQRFEDLLARASCEVVLTSPEAIPAPLTSLLADLQALVEQAAGPDRDTLAALVAACGACTEPAALSAALDRLSTVWAASREDTVAAPGSVAAADDEDELAMLRADDELAGMFLAESLDHLSSIEAVALQLETAPGDRHLLNELFRPFHTVKGNAGALGITSVQALAHAVENLLDLARSGKHQLGPVGVELVLQAVDLLSAMLRDLGARLGGATPGRRDAEREAMIARLAQLIADGEPPAAPVPDTAVSAAAPAPVPVAAAVDPSADMPRTRAEDRPGQLTVKVDTRKLDNLVDMVGELVIVQSIINEDPTLHALLDERLGRNLAQLRRITSDLQRTAMSMRLVPIRQTFQKMARLVRDLGKRSGKVVDLALSGEDTELDRRVVEDIGDPLMHMIRNSVDHGIERPDVRVAKGKPSTGRLSLSAYHQGGHVMIRIADDGGGLDTQRILAKAVAQGLVAADAALAPADIHALIFKPGFSTAEQVTEISGRGVGMDVVRRNIEALRGRIDIESTPGEGTTFTIRLPLTLAIVDGLLLRVGSHRFVLPTFSVCESLRPAPDHVHHVQGRPRMVRVRETLLPLVRLADLFGIPDAEVDATKGTVVVIEDDDRRIALQIDQLLGKQEVVVKSLGTALGEIPGVTGGAILGDGRVGLILDAHGLLELNLGTLAAA